MANQKPEEIARDQIDKNLEKAGWTVQSVDEINLAASKGVCVREFPTSSGPVDYAIFVNEELVGVIEAKRETSGVALTAAEEQSKRYSESDFKWLNGKGEARFAYEATNKLIRFTDYHDKKYRSRTIFNFHKPETLENLLKEPDTIRNNLKNMPELYTKGLRDCQINALTNLDKSLAENRPKALIQMATGAGKTFTAITASYRMLKFGKMNRILFLVDTTNLGKQAESEFMAYVPFDDNRTFNQIYGVNRLRRSYIPSDVQVCISTIQRMYSILKGEELAEEEEDMDYTEESMLDKKAPKEVVYNEKYPPEFFDCIIVDECHRSIYNVWKQVLEYFDAYIIGLTATPDKRTFAFFDSNIVSEYTREQAIVDRVNVGEDIFVIETEIGSQGGHIPMEQQIERRNRLSREKRWEQLDEDLDYTKKDLDKNVVNPSQIRTVIRGYKENLPTKLFPERSEVPKTLIFAKDDSHADDIVQIVREEFGEGNEFCKKITYRADNPDAVLSAFRNDYYPRVAVTVDMIATGTDVKPLEVLIFMRDVRSKNFFEQMKGRGTRTLSLDDLRKVTPSAITAKDHFVIIDAVGVTKSTKTDTRPLERKPTVSLKDLMMQVAVGSKDEDVITSLANRIARLNNQIDDKQRADFQDNVGVQPSTLASRLLNAFDPDCIIDRAKEKFNIVDFGQKPTDEQVNIAKNELINEAVTPFKKPSSRDFIENLRKSLEQVIDNINVDSITFADFDPERESKAKESIQSFREFIEENKDEILALRIIYDQRYVDRPMAIEQLKELYQKLKREKQLTIEHLWGCYNVIDNPMVKKSVTRQITDLISLIRFEMGQEKELAPFADRINYNFMQWTLKKNAGNVHFTEEQMEWLRLIRDHISASLSVEPEDLDLSPFDHKGGLGKFYEVFGVEYLNILLEMNRVMVA